MKKKQPMYMWQCVKCKEYLYSENKLLRHCGSLVQWIQGIEGKGIDMNSPKIKIKVTGYIEMSKESLEVILGYKDSHTGLVYSLPMGYVNTSNLEFEPEE